MKFISLAQVAFLAVGVLAEDPPRPAPYQVQKPPLDTPWTYNISTNPWSEYPRPQRARSQWQGLNGIWGWQAAEGEGDLEHPPLGGPLETSIMVPSCIESGLSGIQELERHFSWYQTSFSVPADWDKDHRVLLNFGAVDYEAVIFVNGVKAASHRGGYFEFTVDLTGVVNRFEPNELLIFVFDPTDRKHDGFDFGDPEFLFPSGKQSEDPGHIFYRPCTGIWQSVWIESAPNNWIDDLHVTADMHGVLNITTDAHDLDNVSFEVELWERINGTSQTEPPADGSAEVFSHICVSATNKACVIDVPASEGGFTPKLWSPSEPNLYNMRITLTPNRTDGDVVHSYMGFRSLGRAEVNGVQRPLLNGKFVFQWGTLDQGYWPDGLYTAPNRQAMEYDLRVLKDLGFNMVRKHVKIEPALYYHACDTLGLLVMQDMPNHIPDVPLSRENQEEFERQVLSMVKQLRNYPSVASWVIYNEGWGQMTAEHVEVAITENIRDMDTNSGRLINANSGWYDHGAGDFSDNHHYSSPQCGVPWASKPGMPYDSKRIALQGEFGGIGHNVSIEQ